MTYPLRGIFSQFGTKLSLFPLLFLHIKEKVLMTGVKPGICA